MTTFRILKIGMNLNKEIKSRQFSPKYFESKAVEGYIIFSDAVVWGMTFDKPVKPRDNEPSILKLYIGGKQRVIGMKKYTKELFPNSNISKVIKRKKYEKRNSHSDKKNVMKKTTKTYYVKKRNTIPISQKISENPVMRYADFNGLTVFEDGTIFGKFGNKKSLLRDNRVRVNDRSIPAHIIVAKLFLPNPFGYKNVIFKDGNKNNIRCENLMWCSRNSLYINSNGIGHHVSEKISSHPNLKNKNFYGYTVFEDGSVYDESGMHQATKTIRKSGAITDTVIIRFHHNGIQKSVQVSLLVAVLFVPNPNNHGHVRYKDGDGTNVHADNLIWVPSGNTKFTTNLSDQGLKSLCRFVNIENLCENERVVYNFIHGNESAIIEWAYANKSRLLLKIRCELYERHFTDEHMDIFFEAVALFETKVKQGRYQVEEGLLNHKIIGWMSNQISWMAKEKLRERKRISLIEEVWQFDVLPVPFKSRFPEVDYNF